MRNSKKLVVLAFGAVVAVAFWAGPLQAATEYFRYSSPARTNWDDGVTADWALLSGGAYDQVWTSGNDAVFETTAGTVNVGAGGATVHNITFNITGCTIANNILTLNGSAPTISLAGSATISSTIAGSAGLTLTGGGTLTLGGNNSGTLSGAVIIKQGMLYLNRGANNSSGLAAGTGTITLGDAAGGNATLRVFSQSSNGTVANSIILASSANGTLTLSHVGDRTSTFTSSIDLNGNDLYIKSEGNASGKAELSGNVTGTGDIYLDLVTGAAPQISGSITSIGNVYLKGGGVGVVNNTGLILASDEGGSISGAIGANVTSVTLTGGGTLSLSGNNSARNINLTIKNGTVSVGNDSNQSLGTGPVILGDVAGGDAAISFGAGGASPTCPTPITLGTNALGVLSVKFASVGGGRKTYCGGLIDMNGNNLTIQDDNNSNAGDTGIVQGGITNSAGAGNLTLRKNTAQGILNIKTGALTLNGAITNSGTGTGSVLISAKIAGATSVTQASATSPLTLSGTNTYTGDTIVLNGTLSINNAWLCSTSSVYMATGAIMDLNFTGTNTIKSLYFNGVAQSSGVYGSTALGSSYFSGSGFIKVTSDPGCVLFMFY